MHAIDISKDEQFAPDFLKIDRGFVERTSAAIIVLLVFLLIMNGLAIALRNRFEKRW